VVVLVALAGYTPLPKEPWWREAMFSDTAEQAVRQVRQWLPPSLAAWLPYAQGDAGTNQAEPSNTVPARGDGAAPGR